MKIATYILMILVTTIVAYADCPTPGAGIAEDLENTDISFSPEFQDEHGQQSVNVDVHFYDGDPEDEETSQWVTLKFRKRK